MAEAGATSATGGASGASGVRSITGAGIRVAHPDTTMAIAPKAIVRRASGAMDVKRNAGKFVQAARAPCVREVSGGSGQQRYESYRIERFFPVALGAGFDHRQPLRRTLAI